MQARGLSSQGLNEVWVHKDKCHDTAGTSQVSSRYGAPYQTAAGKETGLVTHFLAGMKGSLPDIIWYSITPTLLQSQKNKKDKRGASNKNRDGNKP